MMTDHSSNRTKDLSTSDQEGRSLYLDLIKRALINLIYSDAERTTMLTQSNYIRRIAGRILRRFGVYLTESADKNLLFEGRCWPTIAHTMLGMRRLDNIQNCVEMVLKNGVPGDFIETGVWRGGACILMRAVLKAYGNSKRTVWAADSFEGLPRPALEQDKRDPAGRHYRDRELAVSMEKVQDNFAAYNLLDNQVRFLKGWFRDTLPSAPIKDLAVIRLDGDLYESTMDAISNLYPKLSVGGYLIVDDYKNIPACKQAISDYRSKHNISDPIQEVDWTAVYWQRSSPAKNS